MEQQIDLLLSSLLSLKSEKNILKKQDILRTVEIYKKPQKIIGTFIIFQWNFASRLLFWENSNILYISLFKKNIL